MSATFVGAPQTLPPYAAQTMDWEWTVPQSSTVPQCSNVTLTWDLLVQNSTPPMLGPFTFTFFREGYEPYTLPVGMGKRNKLGNLTYQWSVQLPVGGPYQVSLADANGAVGGAVPLVSVEAATAPGRACTPTNLVTSTLNLTTSTNQNECATMAMSVTGGTPPYRFTEVIEWETTKTTTYSTGYFNYVLDAKFNSHIVFAATDSTGKGAVGPRLTVGTSNNSSCLSLAPTLLPSNPGLTSVYPGLPTPATVPNSNINPIPNKKVDVAAIAGGVVGGLAFVLLAVIVGALWQRQRGRTHNGHYAVDLFDPTEPASQPATGNSMVTPTPYAYATSSAMSDPGSDGPLSRKSSVAPARHTRGSTFYETFPIIDTSPPYTATDDAFTQTGTVASSSRNPHDSRRFSVGSMELTDTSSHGVGLALGSGIPSELSALLGQSPPISPRGWSPPLPPGAAPPHSPSALQMAEIAMTRTPEDFQPEFLLNPPRSPPPTYL
ncbi:hypothetical protein FRB95_009322 [Tulasnella sp. JGI-2019a]|nr:hypothetical protein FRB93_013761 [Tulasnella sp. JGI-2019a]KAG9026180.1 hypothetical protein FRB95_009322 [Tulasnella sp. JGI-2019a]